MAKGLWLPLVIVIALVIYFTTNPYSKKKKNLKVQKLTCPESHDIVGVNYRQEAVRSLLTESWKYRQSAEQLTSAGLVMVPVYRYCVLDTIAALVPEPTNIHDKNAIKVVVGNQYIGYISSDENIHVGAILRDPSPKTITISIYSGPYKMVLRDGTVIEENGNVKARVAITPG